MPTFAKVVDPVFRNKWVHGIVDQVDNNKFKVRLVFDKLAAAEVYFCSKRSYDANIAKGAVVPFTDPPLSIRRASSVGSGQLRSSLTASASFPKLA